MESDDVDDDNMFWSKRKCKNFKKIAMIKTDNGVYI